MRERYFMKLCSFLLAAAPIMLSRIESMIFVGEPKVPNCLKDPNVDIKN